MGLFTRLFGRRADSVANSNLKRYEFTTGNIELAVRVQRGEPVMKVIEELKPKWTPGNEYLWDEYDAESLIDTPEKRWQTVNCLLYGRLSIFRALRHAGKDIRGNDPFQYCAEAAEEARRLESVFPDVFPKAFEGNLRPNGARIIVIREPDEMDDGLPK